MRLLAAISMTLLFACAPHIDRAYWKEMPQSEKVLYVKSLLGAEKVKAAKGGDARRFSRPAEEYVQKIDTAYALGDRRAPNEVLGDLRDR
jgi:hypothetical protein